MIIKIKQSFADARMSGPFRVGETISIEDSIAREWIALDRAVELPVVERAVLSPVETSKRSRGARA